MELRPLWQMWEQAIPHEVIDEFSMKFRSVSSIDGHTGHVSDHEVRDNIRGATVKLVDNIPGVESLILPFINDANENAFQFDIEKIETVRYTAYSEGDYAAASKDWHTDINFVHGFPFDRKLTVHVQMSDFHESQGGDFEFKWAENPSTDALSKKGTVLVFPSYLDHRISKVTSGSNRNITAWVQGPNWR